MSMSLGPLLPGEMYMHLADAHSSTQKVQCSRHANIQTMLPIKCG